MDINIVNNNEHICLNCLKYDLKLYKYDFGVFCSDHCAYFHLNISYSMLVNAYKIILDKNERYEKEIHYCRSFINIYNNLMNSFKGLIEINEEDKFEYTCETGYQPVYGTTYSGCADIKVKGEHTIGPFKSSKIPTGLHLKIPNGHKVMIYPRGSSTLRNIYIHGVIDSDYEGEVYINLINLSDKKLKLEDKQRIAQISLEPVKKMECVEVKDKIRGTNGWGSTGLY
jgi:dUTP pyrophosphatase